MDLVQVSNQEQVPDPEQVQVRVLSSAQVLVPVQVQAAQASVVQRRPPALVRSI